MPHRGEAPSQNNEPEASISEYLKGAGEGNEREETGDFQTGLISPPAGITKKGPTHCREMGEPLVSD